MIINTNEPQTVEATDIEIVLASGRGFAATIRADRGDTLTIDANQIVVVFGNGEEVEIQRRQMAMLTRRRRTITIPAKPFNSAGGAQTSEG